MAKLIAKKGKFGIQDGSPGLVVTGVDSCLKGRVFESIHSILRRWIIFHFHFLLNSDVFMMFVKGIK